jgi:hypothetical protein
MRVPITGFRINFIIMIYLKLFSSVFILGESLSSKRCRSTNRDQGPIKAATSTWKSVTYIKKPINSKAVKPEATIGSAHDTRDV